MTKANKMLEDLGYKEIYCSKNEESFYDHERGCFLHFWKIDKTYDCYMKDMELGIYELTEITVELHLAIHKKITELGWFGCITKIIAENLWGDE